MKEGVKFLFVCVSAFHPLESSFCLFMSVLYTPWSQVFVCLCPCFTPLGVKFLFVYVSALHPLESSFCLFVFVLYIPRSQVFVCLCQCFTPLSTNFQLCRDISRVEPVQKQKITWLAQALESQTCLFGLVHLSTHSIHFG